MLDHKHKYWLVWSIMFILFYGCDTDNSDINSIDVAENEKYEAFRKQFKISEEIITTDSLLRINIPLVVIETNNYEEPTFDKVITPEGCWGNGITNAQKVPGRMLIVYEKKILYDSEKEGIKIKVRGNTTAYEEKKPYKIKLSKAADLLLRGDDKKYADKDWCLIKDELLMAKVGFYLGELIGMTWTPRYKYVNLVMNSKYLGPYMLIEAVEKNNSCRLNVDAGGAF